MKISKIRLPIKSVHIKAGLVAAVLAGTVLGSSIAFAVTGSSTPPTSSTVAAATHAKKGLKHHDALLKRRAAMLARKALGSLLIGKVVSDSSTGGAYGEGSITVSQPNGKQLTFSLTNLSRAWKYNGKGTPPTKESATSIGVNEIVGLHISSIQKGVSWAHEILDTGFAA
ncbi:MAG: hypothetical protein M1483_07490 [Actinobacteria bacterium]|jgi:hypothetical protein|nr:hypothetical protein [Actinomycetota bacterium]MCL6105452.1 hypothetical protein [Actinomycetota bacterium]